MKEIKNNKMRKLVKYSAYIAILNKLKNEGKISQNEYEKIKNKMFLIYNINVDL